MGATMTDRRNARADGPRRPPKHPAGLGLRAWGGVLKRTVTQFKEDNLPDWAAALTYYGVLALFPTLLVLVSLLGLAGRDTVQPLIDDLGGLTPGPARQIISDTLRSLESNEQAAGIAAVLGFAVALWSASGYVGAFMRASNAVYDVREGRPVWRTVPVRIAVTVTVVILLAASALIVIVTGSLARRAGQLLGMTEAAVMAWDIAKWPVLVLLVAVIFAVLYRTAPNVRPAGFRWITPGSVLAVLLWLAASAGFGFYVANFGSYHRTYGTLAGVIVFLIWLWISNIAVLLGLELNAELERGRAIEAGHPPAEEPFAEPRVRRRLPD